MVVAPATHHRIADLRDHFEECSVLVEYDGGLSRYDAERQALAETVRLALCLDPDVSEQANALLESDCPSE